MGYCLVLLLENQSRNEQIVYRLFQDFRTMMRIFYLFVVCLNNILIKTIGKMTFIFTSCEALVDLPLDAIFRDVLCIQTIL